MLANFSYVNKVCRVAAQDQLYLTVGYWPQLPRSFPVANRARDKRRYFLLRQVLNEKKAALANKTRTVLTFVCKWKQFCQDLSRHSNVTDVLVLYMSAHLPRAPRAIPFSSNLSRLSWFGSIPSILVQSLRDCLKLDDLKLVNFRDLFVVQDLLEAVGPRLKILELRVARNATLRPTRSWYRHFFTAVAVHLWHLYCCPVTFDHELIAALPPNLRTITMVDSGLSRRPLACCVLHFALALNDGSCLPNVVALPNCFVRLWRDYQYIMDPIVLTCLEEDCPGKVQCHMVGLTRYGGMKFDEVVGLACDTAQRAVRSRRRSLGIKVSNR